MFFFILHLIRFSFGHCTQPDQNFNNNGKLKKKIRLNVLQLYLFFYCCFVVVLIKNLWNCWIKTIALTHTHWSVYYCGCVCIWAENNKNEWNCLNKIILLVQIEQKQKVRRNKKIKSFIQVFQGLFSTHNVYWHW